MIRFLQQDSKFTKAVFWTIIAGVSIFMVVTLIPGIFATGGDASTTYATVRSGGLFNRFLTTNDDISTLEVQRMAARQLQQQKLPEQLMPYMMTRAGQSLIQQAILVRQADKLGLKPTDNDLRTELKSGQFGQYLFPEGKFVGDDQYAYFVSANFQMSIADFETTLKKELELQRLEQTITAPVTVTDADVRKEYMDQGTKVKFDYAVLTAADVRGSINPTDSDLQSFYKSHTAQYAKAAGETRRLEYFAIDPAQVPGGTPQVTDAQISAYYQAHKDEYSTKEQVRARHILIAVAAGATPQQDADAKKKADDIAAQLKNGGDWNKLAAANSADPGSKDKGGELGFQGRGLYVPAFEKVAFDQPVGTISAPVKTQFGYHIIQTEEKKPAHVADMAEVKPQIVPTLQREAELKAAKDYASKLADQAKSQGIDKVASANHLTPVTTDYLSQNGVIAGLPDGAPMLNAAFDGKPGAAPQAVSTGEGFAVFQVRDIKAAHAPSFAEYKDHVLDDYRTEKTPAALQQKMQQIADAAKDSGDLAKAAAAAGATVKSSDLVGRDGQVPQIGSIASNASAIFDLNNGQISAPLTGPEGSYLVKLTDKQTPTPTDLQGHFEETKDKLLQTRREQAFSIYASELQDRYQKEKRIFIAKRANDATVPAQSGS